MDGERITARLALNKSWLDLLTREQQNPNIASITPVAGPTAPNPLSHGQATACSAPPSINFTALQDTASATGVTF